MNPYTVKMRIAIPDNVSTCEGPCTSCVTWNDRPIEAARAHLWRPAGETRTTCVSSAARSEAQRAGNLDVRGRRIDRGATEAEGEGVEARVAAAEPHSWQAHGGTSRGRSVQEDGVFKPIGDTACGAPSRFRVRGYRICHPYTSDLRMLRSNTRPLSHFLAWIIEPINIAKIT